MPMFTGNIHLWSKHKMWCFLNRAVHLTFPQNQLGQTVQPIQLSDISGDLFGATSLVRPQSLKHLTLTKAGSLSLSIVPSITCCVITSLFRLPNAIFVFASHFCFTIIFSFSISTLFVTYIFLAFSGVNHIALLWFNTLLSRSTMLVETILPRRDVMSKSGQDPSKEDRTTRANSGIASVIFLHLSSVRVCQDVPCWNITFVSNGLIPASWKP